MQCFEHNYYLRFCYSKSSIFNIFREKSFPKIFYRYMITKSNGPLGNQASYVLRSWGKPFSGSSGLQSLLPVVELTDMADYTQGRINQLASFRSSFTFFVSTWFSLLSFASEMSLRANEIFIQ